MTAVNPTRSETAAEVSLRERRRNRATRRSVLVMDRLANWTITVGGVFVILAVFAIMAFLVEVVVPLFTGGEVIVERALAPQVRTERALENRVDEYKTVAAAVLPTGEVKAFHVGTGQPLAAPRFDVGGGRITAFASTLDGANLAFGFADGTIRVGTLGFEASVLPEADAPAGLRALSEGERTDGTAVYSEIPGGQVRRIAVAVNLGAPQKIAESGLPIVALDYRLGGTVERPSRAFVTVDAEGVVRLSRSETRINLLTRQATDTVETTTLPAPPAGMKAASVLITEKADQVYLSTARGTLYRYDARSFQAPVLAETIDLLPPTAEVTAMRFLIGEQSLVVGGSDGSVSVFFRLERPDARTTDGYAMVKTKTLAPQKGAIVEIDASQRGKTFATAAADGTIWIRHATSEQTLLRLQPKGSERHVFTGLAFAPREDGIVALTAAGLAFAWHIAVPHPETTPKSVFAKVWYEGYPEPTFTWQSSSGTDSFEPKVSLVPLIFGTIKATVYSLLFAIPVALLAAIYTSEFLHRRVRAAIKPVMEMMASLPSVVLGFIAALILAPFVETWIAAVLLAFVALPLSLLAGAYAWQLIPKKTALALDGIPKLAMMFVVIALGAWVAFSAGSLFERAFFAGDLKAWANGDAGSSVPFVSLLCLPLAFAAVAGGARRIAGPWFEDRMRRSSHLEAGLLDIARWIVLLAAAAVAAYALASLLGAVGYDPRGGVVDTYVQRNTLVVGFAMGFAVIPLIYTIAEDALNSVPEHLRAASLACGATPWQTAIHVILPTAVSGVFAAIMIGMGRAVGETMIVVMAAGNTPILDWNVFNGLRALSANIAVELPEAVKDGTLYRMLFLAALTLFVMTFVLNTAAEVVRLRFRKRASQL
jgi:phosphate transport system permease protein